MTITILTSIALFIVAISVLAFLHELGHYLAARLFKIEVVEFGLGFPPRLLKLFTLGGTIFSLNWIPFGAFVLPKGENDPTVPGGLAAANPWSRLAVLLSGPLMNLLAGALIFSALVSIEGAPGGTTIRIKEIAPNSPAEKAGLLENDVLVKIQDVTINSLAKVRPTVDKFLENEITITVQRQGIIKDIKVTPRKVTGPNEGPIGIVCDDTRDVSFLEAIPYGFMIAYDRGRQLLLIPAKLIQGDVKPEQARIVGPKGIYDMFNWVRSRDQASAASGGTEPALDTYAFIATISIALGLTNLLPIPALDGGRIIFVLPELIIGKRVPARFENMVHLIGFATLLLLLVYVTAQDFINPISLP